ncbi:hypothetical protein ACH4Q7_22685 [Streptomyces roseolus]|uniref:hypothetical protein n=1 Tax=Streptomyces roseolus TaxID=67358 RepID=UPI0037A7A37F
MSTTKTWVSVDDQHVYPATVDLTNRWNGWLSPGFTIDTVRELARHTEEIAEADGYDCNDQIIVIDGQPQPVVLHVRWMYHKEETGAEATDAVEVIKPDADGLYWIGGWEWTWYELKDGPQLHQAASTVFDAWTRVLGASARRIGEILRTQMPDATSCVIDLTQLGHIVSVEGEGGGTWPSTTGDDDGPDGYGPFDGETLGAADEVLRQALDHGRDRVNLEIAHWRPVRNSPFPLHRIEFPPAELPDLGDSLLAEARAAFAEARLAWLTESAPLLVRDAMAACSEAVGVVVDPSAEAPFVMFLVDNDGPAKTVSIALDAADKLTERLAVMFAYRPTGADLTAAGWSSDTPAALDGAYCLHFPKA